MGTKTTVLLFWLQVWVFVFPDVWKTKVEHEMKALVSSCVVFPCSFQYPGTRQPSDRTRGIWHKNDKWDDYVYYEDPTRIVEIFKGRTRLVGRLGELNCSLEIDDVKGHDNGPFCFRVELETSEKDKYSFVDNCVHINMIEEASQPEQYRYNDIGHGNWEVESILTFTPTKDDDHADITCTVSYHGVRDKFAASRPIFVKGFDTFDNFLVMLSLLTVIEISAVIFSGVFLCCRDSYKRKKRHEMMDPNVETTVIFEVFHYKEERPQKQRNY